MSLFKMEGVSIKCNMYVSYLISQGQHLGKRTFKKLQNLTHVVLSIEFARWAF